MADRRDEHGAHSIEIVTGLRQCGIKCQCTGEVATCLLESAEFGLHDAHAVEYFGIIGYMFEVSLIGLLSWFELAEL